MKKRKKFKFRKTKVKKTFWFKLIPIDYNRKFFIDQSYKLLIKII